MKKFFNKKVLPITLTVVMALGATACTNSAETTEPANSENNDVADNTADGNKEVIELEFWGWWSSDARKPHLEYMVNGFNESQDEIHVTYVDIPWGDIFTKNIAQIAAGNPADVMAGGLNDVRYRASQDQLTQLNDYIDSAYLDNFYDTFSNAVTEDGNIYAIPLVGDTRFIYYNKNMFEEIGISEEKGNLPDTWEELQDVAYQLDKYNADGTLDVMGFHPNLGNGGAETWFVNAKQGTFWYDWDSEELAINNQEGLNALDYINSYTEHYTQRSYDEYMAAFSSGMSDPFVSEKLGMLLQTNAYVAAINQNAPDLNYGVLLMPEMVEGNGRAVNGGGFSIEVPRGAKNPEASMEFIKWMTSPEMQEYWTSNMGEVPTRNDVDSEALKNNLIYTKSQEALTETYIGFYPNEIADINDTIVKPQLDLALSGIKTPEQALADAEQTAIATYNIK